MNNRTRVQGGRQAGISIIELLISLIISMAVVAGAVQVVASSKRNFMDQDEVTFIQTNARYALDLIAKDVRMAGYAGCATKTAMDIANSLNSNFDGYVSLQGLQGFEGEINNNAFPADFKDQVKADTDAILIRRASDENELDVKQHNASTATINFWQSHEYDNGSVLMIADASCRHVGLFQASGASPSSIDHIMGGSTENCTNVIKGNFACDVSCTANECGGATAAAGTYGVGSKVMGFIAHAYFIGESSVLPGMPALKRQALAKSGAPVTATEELAVGVEDMQILYGVDSDGDGAVDQFRKASDMDLDGDGHIRDADWARVMSVKVSLVFRSQNPVLPQAQTKTFAGKDYNDRYMRQVVNSTLRIRNRG